MSFSNNRSGVFLSQSEMTQLQFLFDSQQFAAAYEFVADTIRTNNLVVDSGLLRWIDSAARINADFETPDSVFIRQYTISAATLLGKPPTEQGSGDRIGGIGGQYT